MKCVHITCIWTKKTFGHQWICPSEVWFVEASYSKGSHFSRFLPSLRYHSIFLVFLFYFFIFFFCFFLSFLRHLLPVLVLFLLLVLLLLFSFFFHLLFLLRLHHLLQTSFSPLVSGFLFLEVIQLFLNDIKSINFSKESFLVILSTFFLLPKLNVVQTVTLILSKYFRYFNPTAFIHGRPLQHSFQSLPNQ